MIDGVSSQPFSASTMPPIKEPEKSFRNEVVEMSRKQFAVERTIVEQDVMDWHKDKGTAPKKPETKSAPEVALNNTPDKKTEPITAKVILDKPSKAEVSSDKEKKESSSTTVKSFSKPKYFKREEIRPAPPKLDLPDDDFVQLKDLKIKPVPVNNGLNSEAGKAKKVMDPKSLSELRAVLQSFTKDKKSASASDGSGEVKPASVQNSGEAREEKKREPEKIKVVEKKEILVKEKPKEIPEEELRKMLQVDNKK